MNVGLHDVFFESYDLVGDEYSDIFNMMTSDRKTETDVDYVGFTPFAEKPEGTSIAYEKIVEGYKKIYTMRTFAKGFRASMEARDDDQYNVIADAARQLGKLMGYTRNQDAANVFNRAFNATYPGPDQVSLCNASHPLKGGGTGANRPSSDADLSVAAYQAALTRFDKQVNENSLMVMITPKILFVPADLRFTGATILHPGGLPGTANNDANVAIEQFKVQLKVGHFLTDSDAWFLISDKSQHKLRWFWRLKPKTESDGDFDTKDSKFSVIARWDVGFSNWRGVDGTAGA